MKVVSRQSVIYLIRCGALVTGADLPFIHAFLITCHMVGLRHCMDEVNQGSPLDCKKADREHHAIGRPSCVPGGRHAAAARARGVFGVYVCSLLQGLKAPEDNKLKMRTTKSKRDDGPESRPVQTCPDLSRPSGDHISVTVPPMVQDSTARGRRRHTLLARAV